MPGGGNGVPASKATRSTAVADELRQRGETLRDQTRLLLEAIAQHLGQAADMDPDSDVIPDEVQLELQTRPDGMPEANYISGIRAFINVCPQAHPETKGFCDAIAANDLVRNRVSYPPCGPAQRCLRDIQRLLSLIVEEIAPKPAAPASLKAAADFQSALGCPPAGSDLTKLADLAEARFMAWHQGLPEERERKLKEKLRGQRLTSGGRAAHAFSIEEELLTLTVEKRIAIYKGVSDEFKNLEMLSKPRIDELRERVMRLVKASCGALQDDIERVIRAAGDGSTLPEPHRYVALEAKILDVVNAHLRVLETEGIARRVLSQPATDSGNRQPKRGPEVRVEHRAIGDAAKKCGPEWKHKLHEVAENLDKNGIPPRRRWTDLSPPARSWRRAATHHPSLVIKAIEYSLRMSERT